MRNTRTPGCVQQKREAVSSTSTTEAGETTPAARPSPGAPARDPPSAGTAGRTVDPTLELRQAAEVPAPARSERQETVDPRGPPPPDGAPATCGNTRSSAGGDGGPAAPSKPYGFAYNAGTHYHWERGFANGTKIGAYAVQLPDGTLRTTTYSADCNGFKPSVTVEPFDESKFLRDFEAVNLQKEAESFEKGGQPQASILVRSEPAPAPRRLLRRPVVPQGARRSAEVAGAPPGLTQREEQRKTVTTTTTPITTEPTTTAATTPITTETTTTAAPPPTTAAPPRTSASPPPSIGGSSSGSPARHLSPIVPLRPVGSGPYHFYVHLRHNYHEERSYENGTVAGQYGVVAPDGVLREVAYTSEHGFVPTLTDTPVSVDHDLSTRPRKL